MSVGTPDMPAAAWRLIPVDAPSAVLRPYERIEISAVRNELSTGSSIGSRDRVFQLSAIMAVNFVFGDVRNRYLNDATFARRLIDRVTFECIAGAAEPYACINVVA